MNNRLRSIVLSAMLLFPGVVGLGAVAHSAACTPAEIQEAKTIGKDALTVAQLACIAASALDAEPAAVMTGCKIDQQFAPFVQQQLSQKAAAHRASACAPAADAGK